MATRTSDFIAEVPQRDAAALTPTTVIAGRVQRHISWSAVIGGIAGGGKGAAIGMIVGGAGGAGSLAVKGSKELKIESGTEMLVHVTR